MKIYLASPYSHPDGKVRIDRFHAACKAAAKLIEQGHIVFSPVAHSHPIADYLNNHNDGDYWLRQDLGFLDSWADEMWVLRIEGWKGSKGIEKEMEYAKRIGIEIRYIDEG